jgi:Domain of unknown function (DUF4296)
MIRAWYLFLLVFAIACSSNNPVPSHIIPPNKMQGILWDMFRAGNFVTSYQIPADTTLQRSKEQIKWLNRVLHLHQVTESQFKTSMQYYKDHPAILATIMDSLSRKSLTPVVVPKPEVKSVE